MLRELRDLLAAEEGRPVRVEVLARRLGTDPATVSAMLAHARSRGLLPVASEPFDPASPSASPCSTDGCEPSRPSCRHCPLVSPRARR